MTTIAFPVTAAQNLAALGSRLALARRARQLTQRDLALLAGVGTNSIASLEKGHPGVAMGTLVRVLDAIDLLSEMKDLMQSERDPALARYALDRLGV